MFYHALTGNSKNIDNKHGIIEKSNSQQKIVTGFKPKYISIVCKTSNGTASNSTIYENGTLWSSSTKGIGNLPNSVAGTINSIDDDGFTVGAFTNTAITEISYIATT